jgi:hypothetical protein
MKFKTQKQLFLFIWETRGETNGYKSELSGNQLYHINHPKWHFQFLHVLSKGAYPAYRLNPDNILLGTPEEHARQEQYDIFNEKKQELKEAYYKDQDVKH